MKRFFNSAFVWKCIYMCKHRLGVQLFQNPPLCRSTYMICSSVIFWQKSAEVWLRGFVRSITFTLIFSLGDEFWHRANTSHREKGHFFATSQCCNRMSDFAIAGRHLQRFRRGATKIVFREKQGFP